MTKTLFKQYTVPGMLMLALASGLLVSQAAHSVALYDASVEANLVITTNNPDLVVNSAIGFTDFFADVSPAGPGSDAFGDADFFSTPNGFSAYAHADGTAVASGASGDTVVVESYGESYAFMDVEFLNAGANTLTVNFFVDYLWDWALGVDSQALEFAGLDLYLAMEIDGIFTTLVDIITSATPAGSDSGGSLDLFSFELDPYGFSTLSMLLIASGSADSTVPTAVPEPGALVLMLLGLIAMGLSRRRSLHQIGITRKT